MSHSCSRPPAGHLSTDMPTTGLSPSSALAQPRSLCLLPWPRASAAPGSHSDTGGGPGLCLSPFPTSLFLLSPPPHLVASSLRPRQGGSTVLRVSALLCCSVSGAPLAQSGAQSRRLLLPGCPLPLGPPHPPTRPPGKDLQGLPFTEEGVLSPPERGSVCGWVGSSGM